MLAHIAAILALAVASGRTHTVVAGVADVNTGQPLVGAMVRIPELGRVARSAAIGRAVFADVPAARIRIEARMLGYAPVDVDVLVRDGDDTVEVVLLMQPRTTTLDTIRTTATRLTTAAAREIAVRERMGIGRFLTDSVLRREGTRELPTMLSSRLSGLRTWIDAEGRRELESARPTGTLVSRPCTPDLFLDGWEWKDADFSLMSTADIAAVEWYTGDSAPAQYRRPGHACGTLLLWTKFAVDPTGEADSP